MSQTEEKAPATRGETLLAWVLQRRVVDEAVAALKREQRKFADLRDRVAALVEREGSLEGYGFAFIRDEKTDGLTVVPIKNALALDGRDLEAESDRRAEERLDAVYGCGPALAVVRPGVRDETADVA